MKKPIIGFTDYFVTDDGIVLSKKSGREKVLSLKKDRYGYMVAHLSENGKAFDRLVHRLVATAFIPNPEGKPFVNHKDGDKTNNSVDNLEWVTQKENIRHSIEVLGNCPRKLNNGKKKPVLKLDPYMNVVGRFDSLADAFRNEVELENAFIRRGKNHRLEKECHIFKSGISRCCIQNDKLEPGERPHFIYGFAWFFDK